MPWIVYWFKLRSVEDQLLLVSTSSHQLLGRVAPRDVAIVAECVKHPHGGVLAVDLRVDRVVTGVDVERGVGVSGCIRWPGTGCSRRRGSHR